MVGCNFVQMVARFPAVDTACRDEAVKPFELRVLNEPQKDLLV
jgi:hypothetical protein